MMENIKINFNNEWIKLMRQFYISYICMLESVVMKVLLKEGGKNDMIISMHWQKYQAFIITVKKSKDPLIFHWFKISLINMWTFNCYHFVHAYTWKLFFLLWFFYNGGCTWITKMYETKYVCCIIYVIAACYMIWDNFCLTVLFWMFSLFMTKRKFQCVMTFLF